MCHDAFLRAAGAATVERRIASCSGLARSCNARNVSPAGLRHASPLKPDTAASRENPARDAEIGELRERLEAAMSLLTAVQREVVLLHDMDGWSHADIGVAIGTSEGMSRQHLFQARRRLRETIGQDTSKERN